MAIDRLWPPIEWGYDTDTGQIVMRLRKAPEVPDIDETPDKEAIVRLDIADIEIRDLGPAP